ncbi:hypothetical protein B4U80_02602 [Leptotrombidium deliense]|uniref:Uncharacterized protein n=1 Tax=Leptotrombidium deliense TaxID=299467 RepID=A0A443SWD1_9ACAR|nr:hypothetical protein B4U80_02602 [Leptotrombidium deliense]
MVLQITSILTALVILGSLISSWSIEKRDSDKITELSGPGSDLYVPIPPPPPQLQSLLPIRYHFRSKPKPRVQVISKRQEGRGFDGYHDVDAVEYETAASGKSEFLYILPILLVIGLGSFLIPIMSTFFTALITSGGAGQTNPAPKQKGSRSGFDPNFGLWSSTATNRFDAMQLLPVLLILGLGIMLLPIITSCLTTLFSPMAQVGSPYFPHGKKKRELLEQGLPSMTDVVINLLANLEKAIEKYGKE